MILFVPSDTYQFAQLPHTCSAALANNDSEQLRECARALNVLVEIPLVHKIASKFVNATLYPDAESMVDAYLQHGIKTLRIDADFEDILNDEGQTISRVFPTSVVALHADGTFVQNNDDELRYSDAGEDFNDSLGYQVKTLWQELARVNHPYVFIEFISIEIDIPAFFDAVDMVSQADCIKFGVYRQRPELNTWLQENGVTL